MTAPARQALPATRIDYVEFYATDLAATRRFYEAAFGWHFTAYGTEYLAFSGAGLEGGFHLLKEPSSQAQPQPSTGQGRALVILYTETLEGVLNHLKDLGAPISAEIFPFPGGRRFQFLDPNGNELGVWSDQ